jgi:hypothetical protein
MPVDNVPDQKPSRVRTEIDCRHTHTEPPRR